MKLGEASYQELTGVKKPKLNEQGVLHWPVLLYPEVMSVISLRIFRKRTLFHILLSSDLFKLHGAFFD